ncbi:hypothetical protein Esti_005958 [Eimeria stiedai]
MSRQERKREAARQQQQQQQRGAAAAAAAASASLPAVRRAGLNSSSNHRVRNVKKHSLSNSSRNSSSSSSSAPNTSSNSSLRSSSSCSNSTASSSTGNASSSRGSFPEVLLSPQHQPAAASAAAAAAAAEGRSHQVQIHHGTGRAGEVEEGGGAFGGPLGGPLEAVKESTALSNREADCLLSSEATKGSEQRQSLGAAAAVAARAAAVATAAAAALVGGSVTAEETTGPPSPSTDIATSASSLFSCRADFDGPRPLHSSGAPLLLEEASAASPPTDRFPLPVLAAAAAGAAAAAEEPALQGSLMQRVLQQGVSTTATKTSSSSSRGAYLLRCQLSWGGVSAERFIPVEGCELSPIIVFRDAAGRVCTADDQQPQQQQLLLLPAAVSAAGETASGPAPTSAAAAASAAGAARGTGATKFGAEALPSHLRGGLPASHAGSSYAAAAAERGKCIGLEGEAPPCSARPSCRVLCRWQRGPPRVVCTLHPHREARIQCVTSLRCFCSYACFARGQQQLRRFYLSGGRVPIPPHPNPFTYGAPCRPFSWTDIDEEREADSQHLTLLAQAGLVEDASLQQQQQQLPAAPSSSNQGEGGASGLALSLGLQQQQQRIGSGAAGAAGKPGGPPPTHGDPLEGDLHGPPVSCCPRTGWSVVSWSRSYVPTCQEVGRQLLFEAILVDEEALLQFQQHQQQQEEVVWRWAAAAGCSYWRIETACCVPSVDLARPRPLRLMPQQQKQQQTLLACGGGRAGTSRLAGGAPLLVGAPAPSRRFRGTPPLIACKKAGAPARPPKFEEVLQRFLNGGASAASPVVGYEWRKGRGGPPSQGMHGGGPLLHAGAVAPYGAPSSLFFQNGGNMGGFCLSAFGGEVGGGGLPSLEPSSSSPLGAPLLTGFYGAAAGSAQAGAAATQSLSGFGAAPPPLVAGSLRASSVSAPGPAAAAARGAAGLGDGSACSSRSIRVLSWNVLAEIYSTSSAFPHCEAYVLAWPYRRGRILKELLQHRPDVICLQEVQREHFEEYFMPLLSAEGYEGVYKQKTTEIFAAGSGQRRGGRFTMDGCATFFLTNKLRVRDFVGLEFAELVKAACTPQLAKHRMQGAAKRLLKDNVALLLLLELREDEASAAAAAGQKGGTGEGPLSTAGESVDCSSGGGAHAEERHKQQQQQQGRQVLVVNTHVAASPESTDAKIWQTQTLVGFVNRYLSSWESCGSVPPALLVCGDFNSAPDSAVYELLATGACSRQHPDLLADRHGLLEDIELGHPLGLKSAYAVSKAAWEDLDVSDIRVSRQCEPAFTNYTEAQTLQLGSAALPSPLRPSDHIPLIGDFEWMD